MTNTDTNRLGGRNATKPWAIPPKGWLDVASRSWKEAGQDNISLVASGVAFCGVLAMVPLLGAIVLSYGLIATPQTVMKNVQALTSIMPVQAAKLIGERLADVIKTSDGKKGFGLLIALSIAMYGAMKGASALITSLNIAYDEIETRSFVKLNLLTLAITVGAVLVAIVAIVGIGAMASLEKLFPSAPESLLALCKMLSYVVMAGAGAAAAATLYRYGPNRDAAQWVWLTPGSVLTTFLWLALTLGFGAYVANFGNYDATYGSMGAAIVLLTWLYLSAYILLLGAEFNCELERQTTYDTTTGPERAMGERRAFAADTVAAGATPTPKAGPGPNAGLTPDGQARAPTADPATISENPFGRFAKPAVYIASIARTGMLASLLAVGGLRFLRRPGRARLGVVLLIAGGTASWLTRSTDNNLKSKS